MVENPIFALVRKKILAEIDRKTAPLLENVARSNEEIERLKEEIKQTRAELLEKTGGYDFYIPNHLFLSSLEQPYMANMNCVGSDFFHQKYREFCKKIAVSSPDNKPTIIHRKFWEFAFIAHHLGEAGVLMAGKRGLGFGVGQEQLPSFFANQGCSIVATDAPLNSNIQKLWSDTKQHAEGLALLHHPEIIGEDEFAQRVVFEPCDMNNISDHLKDFDFCWSACCFEHLGSIEKGLDFVVESVEKTLKIGGFACHTTEFNLSSDEETVEADDLVLFRKQDFERLFERLRSRGHSVKSIPLNPGLSLIDNLVDVPPYLGDAHLKIKVGEFVTTSVGIVIQRGR